MIIQGWLAPVYTSNKPFRQNVSMPKNFDTRLLSYLNSTSCPGTSLKKSPCNFGIIYSVKVTNPKYAKHIQPNEFATAFLKYYSSDDMPNNVLYGNCYICPYDHVNSTIVKLNKEKVNEFDTFMKKVWKKPKKPTNRYDFLKYDTRQVFKSGYNKQKSLDEFNALSDEEKQKYINMEEKDQIRYATELKEWYKIRPPTEPKMTEYYRDLCHKIGRIVPATKKRKRNDTTETDSKPVVKRKKKTKKAKKVTSAST